MTHPLETPDSAEPVRAYLERVAPWLFARELATCIVGSTALAEACRRAGVAGPECADLDLAWAPDVDAGSALLDRHGVRVETTDASRARGTLAMRVDGQRIEITTFRGAPDAASADAIATDLARRDMTFGAVAWSLADDRLHDPFEGLLAWRERRVTPVGDAADRIREHPVRWLRYYRRAHAFDFSLDPTIRRVSLPPEHLLDVPAEAVAAELRSALLECDSPGRFLHELFEDGLLQVVAPELATQFDGRPAGPVRHHPEVGQALHMILALEWAVERTRHLDNGDRALVLLAVLCHDLGKGLTPVDEFPSHRGHETSGIRPIRALFERLPGLGNTTTRRFAEAVCRLHFTARQLRSVRPGTAAKLFDEYFRARDFPADLFALAIGADSGGRLGLAADGDRVRAQIVDDIAWLRERCESVDVGALRSQFDRADVDGFRAALHEARARAIRHSP